MRGLFGHGGGLGMASIAAAVAASVGTGGPLVIHVGRVDGPSPPPEEKRKRPRRNVPARPKFSANDPRVNRWTGKPHAHAREAARNARRAERDRANREARGIPGVMGFSRSALTCYAYSEGKTFRGRKQVPA